MISLIWYSTTPAFQSMVRRRLITELELITGGKVELGSIHATPFRLRIDVRDLTIHGLEKPGEVPYAHVDRMLAQVKVISALGAEFGVSSLTLEHPVVHIIFYPGGTTNQPQPKVERISGKTPVEELFSLSIGELAVHNGEVFWDQEKIPVNFIASDVSATLSYSLLHRHYTGDLRLGKVDTQLKDYRPFSWAAESHFVLTTEGVEVQSLKATSGRSRLQANGRIENFRAPEVQATYIANVDLGELAATARRGDLRRGTMQANGQGKWSSADFSSAGKFQLKDVDYHDLTLDLHKLGAVAEFSVNPKKLSLSQIQVRAFDGTVAGDAELENWNSAPTNGKAVRGKSLGEQKGSVRLRFKELSASALISAITPSSMPLSRANLVGAASGTVETRWTRSFRNSESIIAVDVVPPKQASAGQLPLTMHTRALYRAAPGELQMSQFDTATRATQVHGSGVISSSSALKFTLNTTDIHEWQPVLNAFGEQGRIPLSIHGHATLNGNASGRFPDVTIDASLQAHDFDILLAPLP